MKLADALDLCGLPWPRSKMLKCPEHADKTPSLRLYPNTDSFYCFSCGANGDAYGLVALLTGIPVAAVLARHSEPSTSLLRPRSHYDIDTLISKRLQEMGDTLQTELRGATDRQAVMWWDRWHDLMEEFIDPDAPGYERERACTRLETELGKMVESVRQLRVLKERGEDGKGLQRTKLRSEVPDDGRHGGSSVPGPNPTGEGSDLRVEPTTPDDEADGGVRATHARLLHGDWVASRGDGLRLRWDHQVEGVQVQVSFGVEQEAADLPFRLEQPQADLGDSRDG